MKGDLRMGKSFLSCCGLLDEPAPRQVVPKKAVHLCARLSRNGHLFDLYQRRRAPPVAKTSALHSLERSKCYVVIAAAVGAVAALPISYFVAQAITKNKV